MANRLQKVPLAVYTPAVAAVQARPAYCETQQVFAGYASGGQEGLIWVQVTNSDGSTSLVQIAERPAGNTDFIYSYTYSPLRPTYTTTKVCYPAVAGSAGSPARTDYYSNAGWNGSARSVGLVPPFSFFKATVKALSAAMLGLAGRGFTGTYADMPFAFVVRPSGYTIVERGIDKTIEAALAPGAVLEIQRRFGGKVVYLVGGSEVYTSTARSMDELYGGALLYSLGDYVDSPSISSIPVTASISFSATLPAVRALISDRALARVEVTLPRLYLVAQLSEPQGVIRFSAELPAVRALITDRDIAFMRSEMPALSLAATLSRPEALVSGLSAQIPALQLGALVHSGNAISFAATLPAVRAVIADRELAFMRAELPLSLRVITGEPYLLPGFIDGSELMLAADVAALESAMLLVGIDSLDVGGFASITLVLELFGMDSLALSSSATLGQIVEMLAMEQVAVNSNAATARQQALQYAVNAATGAATTYSGFDFLSFARVDGQAYGLKADGLYRIGAGTDNGELISALIDFGTSDYANSATKHVSEAHIGVRVDGQCYLRVTADDGPQRVYQVTGNNNVRRTLLSKGVAGRYWSTRLELTDVSFAEVDAIELAVGITQRRGFGSRG